MTQLLEQGRAAPVVTAIPGSSVSMQTSSPPVERPQDNAAKAFKNSFLSVIPKSISKAESKRSVNLVLQFENLMDEDLFITLNGHNASLLDDKGNAFALYKINGVTTSAIHYAGNKNSYTLLTPKTQNTVVMVFTSNTVSEGEVFSFSADCFRYGEKSPIQFSVGISNIRLE